MTITKEQIKARIRDCEADERTEGCEEDSFELQAFRLALLGLDRDPRAERIGRAVLRFCADPSYYAMASDQAREEMALPWVDVVPDVLSVIASAMEEP